MDKALSAAEKRIEASERALAIACASNSTSISEGLAGATAQLSIRDGSEPPLATAAGEAQANFKPKPTTKPSPGHPPKTPNDKVKEEGRRRSSNKGTLTGRAVA